MKSDCGRLLLFFFCLCLFPINSVSAQPNGNSISGVESRTAESPVLHDFIRDGASTTSSAQASSTRAENVDSFFQVQPIPQKPLVSENEAKPKLKTFLWHVLDNIGVPMLFYKGDDLDSSLKGSLPAMSAKTGLLDNSSQKQTTTTKDASSGETDLARYKLPASELDGVELPTIRDLPAQSLSGDKNAVQTK